MDGLSGRSPDLVQSNVERLAELFPSVVTERLDADGNPALAVDFDLLRQELSDHVVEGPQERYQLDWPGKRAALLAANAPIAKTLRPVREESVDFDTTKNLFIEGDNLEVLKLLQESYLGKIKLIYIDPPYNTGNDFIYNDDFAESAAEYLARSGQVGDEGERLVANTESNGRFHSDWLSMMYPRLKLARNLLTDDGAIFISINDAEFDNLKRLASEVFGERNFVGTMVWAAGRKNDSKYISASHEYILCFARSLEVMRDLGKTWKVRKKGLEAIYAQADRCVKESGGDFDAASTLLKRWYKALPESDDAKRNAHYSRIDERGVYFADNISWPGGGGPKYDVMHPVTGEPVKIPSRGWLFQEAAMAKHIDDDRVLFGSDESSVPTFKRYLRDTELEVPYSVFYQDGRAATKRLRTLMDADVFDFPKDEHVIQTLVDMVTSDTDIVFDFFAGSGTTGHAVLAQNAADGGKRSFILVQIAEALDKDHRAKEGPYDTIAEISRDRVRRVGDRLREEDQGGASGLDTGFRTLRLDTSGFAEVAHSPDEAAQLALATETESLRPDRSEADLLFQVLLEWGLELSLPLRSEEVAGHEVFVVDEGALIACFDEAVSLDVVRVIAERQPLRAVFRDAGFASDADRINTEQIFAEVSPLTDVKVI